MADKADKTPPPKLFVNIGYDGGPWYDRDGEPPTYRATAEASVANLALRTGQVIVTAEYELRRITTNTGGITAETKEIK
jgi:hypothetical protein